ncbi:hypothetical protein H0H87_007420 [Tephrocybe sp. NHM501043]|nr:hypothetical protein H0H87_007420 [Tephrocybe sp. NHM501043]
MLSFSFSSVNPLNATLTSSNSGSSSTSYRTKTSGGVLGRKTTSLIAVTGGSSKEQPVVGGIDWRGKVLAVDGKTWDLDQLRSQRISGGTSKLEIIPVTDAKKSVRFRNLTSTSSGSGGTPLVTLTQSTHRIFKSSTPAIIQFHHTGSTNMTAELIFFMLVMLYSEIEWQDEQVHNP